MNNDFNSNIFGFGVENEEETNKTSPINIEGLGESNYENEDLFKPDLDFYTKNNIGENKSLENDVEQFNNNIEAADESSFEFPINMQESEKEPENTTNIDNNSNINSDVDSVSEAMEEPFDFNNDSKVEDTNTEFTENIATTPEVENKSEEESITLAESVPENLVESSDLDKETDTVVEEEQLYDKQEEPNETEEKNPELGIIEEPVVDEQKSEDVKEDTQEPIEESITMSDTPIEDLNKLTDYEEDNIESTDINELFDKVNVNVKEASDIFRKNTEMKKKIDARFNELKQLQSELEKQKKSQFDEINTYKEEVVNKLNDKKSEIEKRLNTLKDLQASLEKEKKSFETYKIAEQDKIDKIKSEVQSAYDSRREELSHIEDVLRKQKDSLDEERSQLSLDKIQYESDKNELANNLLKFNELVDSFTNGMGTIKE